jgi:hypothetical protein
VVIVVLAVLFGACDSDFDHHDRDRHDRDHGQSFTAPSPPFVGTFPVVSTRIDPVVAFVPVTSFNCPFVSPFSSTLSLFVDQRSGADLFLDQVAFKFVDGTGLPSPLDLTRAELTGMFGTTLIPTGGTRAFRFHPQFGCGFVGSPQAVFVNLRFFDRRGTSHFTTVSASLR